MLLRAAVALTAGAEGILYFSSAPNLFSGRWFFGLALIIGGAALLIGFLTPLAGLLLALCFVGVVFSWFPQPSWSSHDARFIGCRLIVTCVSISLLGPGAFSLDGRLFGRREIVIPPSTRSPEP